MKSFFIDSLSKKIRQIENTMRIIYHYALDGAQSAQQRQILKTALIGLETDVRNEEFIPFLEVPLSIYSGIHGDEKPAYPLAAMTSLLFLGIDILDDLQDGDTPPHWQASEPSQRNLAAFTLLCALPQKMISEFEIPNSDKILLQKTLSEGFMKMGAGQLSDLGMTHHHTPNSEAVLNSVIQKSGFELGVFTHLACQFSGVQADAAEPFIQLGCHMGTAAQLSSDCYDLFEAEISRDLQHGTRTLPLVLHLEKLSAHDKEKFYHLLDQAQTDAGLRKTIQKELYQSGSVRHTAIIVELYCQKAHRALKDCNLSNLETNHLQKIIDHISFFKNRRQEHGHARSGSTH